jgi:hypothetical protein
MSDASPSLDLSSLAPTDGRLRQALEDAAEKRRLSEAQEKLLGAGARHAFRPKTALEAGIRKVDAKVTVQYIEDPNKPKDDDARWYLEVAVHSLMRPGIFRRVLMDPRSPTALVEAAAGAACEECCEDLGDPFDPDQAVKEAVTQLKRLRR